MTTRLVLFGISSALFGIACGGSVAAVPEPTPEPTPVPVGIVTPPPPATGTAVPGPAAPAPAPPGVTTASLKSACDAARSNLVDGNRWDAIQHFANNGELATALPGKWYGCSKSPLFGAAGIAFHADGTAATLVFDGKQITEDGIANPWSADLSPPAGYEGETFLTGDARFWAVISIDGRQAVMGKPELGSNEWLYVRVD